MSKPTEFFRSTLGLLSAWAATAAGLVITVFGVSESLTVRAVACGLVIGLFFMSLWRDRAAKDDLAKVKEAKMILTKAETWEQKFKALELAHKDEVRSAEQLKKEWLDAEKQKDSGYKSYLSESASAAKNRWVKAEARCDESYAALKALQTDLTELTGKAMSIAAETVPRSA